MTKAMSGLLASSLLLAGFACLACNAGRDGDAAETIELVLPNGDAAAGREAFLGLGCVSCHALGKVEGLPEPVAAMPGPDLSVSLAGLSRGGIATGIVSPSHVNVETEELWTDWDPGQRVWLGPGQAMDEKPPAEASRMVDYRSVMTIQQLADLVAFLEAARE